MQWVLAENCSIKCPIDTLCKRPIEFLEPLHCIHNNFIMPDDLVKDHSSAISQFLLFTYYITTLVLLLIVIGLQVCFIFLVELHLVDYLNFI